MEGVNTFTDETINDVLRDYTRKAAGYEYI